jgi:hypothetical protein
MDISRKFGQFLLLALLLVQASPAPGGVVADAVPIYRISFDETSDVNFDNWPDRWERVSGDNYQHYVDISIVDDSDTDDGRCLEFKLNGGGTQVATPPIRILPKFGYALEYRAKVEGLERTEFTVMVDLLDRKGNCVERVTGPRLPSNGEWIHVGINSFPRIHAEHPDIDRAVLRFDMPRQGRGDLAGKVRIDQIEFIRLPSMHVSTGRHCNVYDDFSQIQIECTLSGIRDQNPQIRFQLLDATSRVIPGKTEDKRIPGRLIVEDLRTAADIVGGIGNRPDGYEGSTVWEPRIDDFGFYKVRVQMLSEDHDDESRGGAINQYSRELDDKEITLAVLPKLPAPSRTGEFGWTLPLADKPLSFDLLEELLPRVGVHWVKLPVWFPADAPARGDDLVRFAERVSGSGIQVVGIVDDPTRAGYAERSADAVSNTASLLQADASFWQPVYDHVMTRLSLRLQYWQLGNDYDTSFYSYPKLSEKVAHIRKHLFRFGQDVKLGIGWRWPPADGSAWIPPDHKPSWEFEQMSSRRSLTADEIEERMRDTPRSKALRWTLIDPTAPPQLPPGLDDLEPDTQLYHELRVREFVRQMVAAKMHGADGIFVANPFTGPAGNSNSDIPDGVMNVDGTPGQMLLPWRTTATLLGGKRYLGSLRLPEGSTNHVFAGDDNQVVMVVWNDKPVTERLYLGEKIRQVDAWGKAHSVGIADGNQAELRVGTLPTFVLNLHPEITRWQMAVGFAKDRLPSIFAIEHLNSIQGQNFFAQGVSGTVSLYVPPLANERTRFGGKASETWELLPREMPFTVGAGEPFDMSFRTLLKEAAYGRQPVRIDFDIEADRRYRFSVWRDIQVGLGDIEISVKSHLNESGHLVVEQHMVNKGDSAVDFRCNLSAPPRRRKRTQVVKLDGEGSTKIYQYPEGEALVGNVLTLKAEELNGQRVLIYRFRAER